MCKLLIITSSIVYFMRYNTQNKFDNLNKFFTSLAWEGTKSGVRSVLLNSEYLATPRYKCRDGALDCIVTQTKITKLETFRVSWSWCIGSDFRLWNIREFSEAGRKCSGFNRCSKTKNDGSVPRMSNTRMASKLQSTRISPDILGLDIFGPGTFLGLPDLSQIREFSLTRKISCKVSYVLVSWQKKFLIFIVNSSKIYKQLV